MMFNLNSIKFEIICTIFSFKNGINLSLINKMKNLDRMVLNKTFRVIEKLSVPIILIFNRKIC